MVEDILCLYKFLNDKFIFLIANRLLIKMFGKRYKINN